MVFPQAIEVRVGPQGVKAKWVRIELRKVETLPGGGLANTFVDPVGQSPINLWQSEEEYDTLTTVRWLQHCEVLSALAHFFFLFLLCSKISNSLFGYLSLSLQVLRWRKAVRLLYHRYQCYRCPDLVSLSLSAGVRYELTGLVCVKGKRCVCPASPICFPIYPSVCKSVHLTRFHSGTQITQRLLPAQQVHVHRDHLTHHHRQTRAAFHLARLLSARDAQSRAGRRRALRGPLRHMLRPGRPDPARGDGQVGQPPRRRLARV